MRIGLVARSNDKGLGTMTWEFAKAMRPARTLVVVRQEDEVHPERFPGARFVPVTDGLLPLEAMRWLLDGCDVLYTAETAYDPHLFELAAEAGVGTVLHGMYEFLDRDQYPPDLYLAPSPWHLADWPQPVRLLPVPIPDRLLAEPKPWPKVPTLVHAGGSPARADRNGTMALLQAAPLMRTPCRVVVRSMAQLRARPAFARRPARVELAGPAEHYWEVHAGADAAVLPRRYGGLCLPLQEATGAGLPVLALDREVDAGYPWAAALPSSGARVLRMRCAEIQRAEVNPRVLAGALDRLLADPEAMEERARASAEAAEALRWSAQRGAYESALAAVLRR